MLNPSFPFTAAQANWIADLLTTDAPQTVQRLRRKGTGVNWQPEGWCCLGRGLAVLGIEPVGYDPFGIAQYANGGMCKSGDLPDAAWEAFGLRGSYGNLRETVTINTFGPLIHHHGNSLMASRRLITIDSLSDFNDRAGWSFKEIGRYILADPWNVFVWPGREPAPPVCLPQSMPILWSRPCR